MASKKTPFRFCSCLFSWLTVLAFIGLAFRSGDSGFSNKTLPVFKHKQEKTVDALCFEPQEEDHDLKVDPHMVNAMMGYEKKYAITKLFESTGSPWSAKKMIPAIHKSFNEGMIKYYLDHAKPMVYANTALKKIKAQVGSAKRTKKNYKSYKFKLKIYNKIIENFVFKTSREK